MEQGSHQFTTTWFQGTGKANWDQLLPQLDPRRILEVGCYEGASTCYLIERATRAAKVEIHCVDPWAGNLHYGDDIFKVEQRWLHNTALSMSRVGDRVQLHRHKAFSDQVLPRMLADGMKGYFDFIYIDGSHAAVDVMFDAVLAFRLLRVNGLIAFDDYLWRPKDKPVGDPTESPKLAIDAFTNTYAHKIKIVPAPLYQLYVQKTGD
jgi:predicted O-methyltransferase YrrM